MLAIQEDKISYVLTGKDLLTDARGDSAITSVPDVLGNQIARSEEFGISNNPESFASYGYYKFFTDAKRNSVISLTGNSYKNDKVEVISDDGMKNWFRDLFLNEFNTEKIGAYDPFSNMYTLTSGGGEKPKTVNNVSCGLDLNQKNSNSTIEYNVQYSDITGDASIDYDFSSGSATIEVVYDGSTVINQSISGQGAVSFSKDKINISSALVTITPSNATYSISINCVDEVPLTVIKAILNTDTTSGETIESAYSWSDSGYTSPRYKRDVTFEEDGVSLYDVSSGSESQGFIPADGATISMFSVRNSLNTFDNSNVTFKYLLSNTLYTEEQLSSVSLQSLNTNEVSDTVYDASFTFDRSGGETYLYLVWDYRLSDLTLIKAVINSSTLSGETIRNSFSWSGIYFESQKYIDDTTLEADEVSLYETTDGVESQGFIPKEGATVKMLSEQTSSTTLDNSIVEFKYLLSNTLYTEQQLSSLSFQSIPKEQIVSTNNYKGEFTYSNPNNFSYLYLIWEYPLASLQCDDTLTVSGNDGIYEVDIEIGVDTGELVLELNSISVPDRFQIEYDGQIVADSLFVGDGLPDSNFENEIINATQLNKFIYNGTNFDAAGTESVNFDAGDIAVSDGSETRANGSGTGQIGVVADYPSSTALASDGNVKLSFNKTNALPQTAKLIVTGVNTGTVWNLLGIECPSGSTTEPEPDCRENDISTASYDDISFDFSPQDSFPEAIAFKPDGTKMYMVGYDSDSVHQYSLSTAYDLSTASYDNISFSVVSQDSIPQGISFKPDGTKMYMVGFDSDSVYQYSLSTAYDISTASYDDISFDFSPQDSLPEEIAFNTDGTKMYMVGIGSDSVHQYTLSTAYDISTASYDNISFSVSEQEIAPEGIAFNTDGTKMYMIGSSDDSVYQYTLSTAYDISTASYDNILFSVLPQDGNPTSIAFKPDGTKMYVVGQANDRVYQYSLCT